MSSQPLIFSGTGNLSSASLTVNTGERVRVRIAAVTGYPALSLSIAQNGVTDVVPFSAKNGQAVEFPACSVGDVISVTYAGQTASDAAVGILESIAAPVPLAAGAALESGGNLAAIASAQGTDGTAISAPSGGSGIRGWLSGIYKALTGTLSVSQAYSAPSSWNGATIDLRQAGQITIFCMVAPTSPWNILIDDGVTIGSPIGVTAVSNTTAGEGTVTAISAVGSYTLPGRCRPQLLGGTGGTFSISWGQ